MNLGLNGKTALITCAGAGLGAACARQLRAEGVNVIGVRRSSVERTSGGPPIRWINCDITDAPSLAHSVRSVGPVDVVIYIPVRERASSAQTARSVDYAEAVSRTFDPCLTLLQELLPGMTSRKFGRFVNVIGASVLAPLWDHTLSNVSRAATLALYSGAAREVAASGVTFNTVVLGLFDTPGLRELWFSRAGSSEKFEQYKAQRLAEIPGGKMGDPIQCAMLCALLASPAMGYLNGQSIWLDGGKNPRL